MATERGELAIGSGFDDLAGIQYEDPVGGPESDQAVGNNHHRQVLELVDGRLDSCLRRSVERGRRLVGQE